MHHQTMDESMREEAEPIRHEVNNLQPMEEQTYLRAVEELSALRCILVAPLHSGMLGHELLQYAGQPGLY